MSMVLSHRTALELYRSSMMPVSGYLELVMATIPEIFLYSR